MDWELTPPDACTEPALQFVIQSHFPLPRETREGVQGGLTAPHFGAPDKSEGDQRNPGPEPPWGGELAAMATAVAL